MISFASCQIHSPINTPTTCETRSILLLTVAASPRRRPDRIGSLLLLLTSPQIGPDLILPAPRQERTPAVPFPVGWTRPSSNHRIRRSNKLQMYGSGYFSCLWACGFMSRKLRCCPLSLLLFVYRGLRDQRLTDSVAGRQSGNPGTGFPGRDLNIALLPD